MKIRKINNRTLHDFTQKTSLTGTEYTLLKDALMTLMKTYAYFEYKGTIDNTVTLEEVYDPLFPRVDVIPEKKSLGRLIGDYDLHSAFLTEDQQIIITAHHAIFASSKYLLTESKATCFLFTLTDEETIEEDFYDCFIDSIPDAGIDL